MTFQRSQTKPTFSNLFRKTKPQTIISITTPKFWTTQDPSDHPIVHPFFGGGVCYRITSYGFSRFIEHDTEPIINLRHCELSSSTSTPSYFQQTYESDSAGGGEGVAEPRETFVAASFAGHTLYVLFYVGSWF